MLLIGSRALSVIGHAAILCGRTPGDIDLIGTWEEFQAMLASLTDVERVLLDPTGNKIAVKSRYYGHIEFEFAWEDNSSQKLVELVENDQDSVETYFFPGGNVTVPSLDVLFAIKSTHRFVSGKHFKKTLADWHQMRNAGAIVPMRYLDWVKARTKETLTRKHPKLNTSKKAFFNPDDGIKYVYDHDSIHRAVAFTQGIPVYTLFQKDGEEVFSDKKKFFDLPLEYQLQSVAEEAAVLAIERAHVPHGKMSPRDAWVYAVEKVCTTISSGWWREFAYENYYKVMEIYPMDYLEKFKNALSHGTILPFKGKRY